MKKSLKRRLSYRRGLEIKGLVPEMLDYVKARYVPGTEYSVRCVPDDPGRNTSSWDAGKEGVLCEPPAVEETYHAWEREHAELKSFSSEVVRMVRERYRKISDFYRASGIDKRTFYKIRTDFGYTPSRKTAFRCCIGLKLSAAEAEKLLQLAGLAFSPNDPDDLVIRFCLEKGIYDIQGINYMLFRYAVRTLD